MQDGTRRRNEDERSAPLFGGGQAKRGSRAGSGGDGEGDEAAREGSLRELGKKRGPMPSGGKREAKKVRKLERENARLREELRKAHIVIEVQGKVSGLLGLSLGDGKSS